MLEIIGKKKLIIVKNEKKISTEKKIELGYYPIVLQDVAGLGGFVLLEGKVYCNLGEVGWGIVSQDIALYCNRGGMAAGILYCDRSLRRQELYRNTMDCIMAETG